MKMIPENFEKFFQELCADIECSTDNRPKEIGDRVYLWDGSSLYNEDNKKYYTIDEEVDGKKFIVIQKGAWPAPTPYPSSPDYINDLKVIREDMPSLILYTKSEFTQLEDFKSLEKQLNTILNPPTA